MEGRFLRRALSFGICLRLFGGCEGGGVLMIRTACESPLFLRISERMGVDLTAFPKSVVFVKIF